MATQSTSKRDTTARNKARRFAKHQRKHPNDKTVFGQDTFQRNKHDRTAVLLGTA